MDPSVPASARELVLIGGCASVMLLATANYLANHAVGRPPPRSAYTVTVVLVCGTLTPAVALAAMIRSGLVESGVSSLGWVELLAALLLSLLLSSLFLRKQPDHRRRRVPMLVAALFAPSLAEVLVFAGLVQGMAAHGVAALLPPALAAGAAVLASSIAFALYHLTHAAPWNGWPLIRTLFLVWLVVGATYAWTGNLWAATIATRSWPPSASSGMT